MRGGYRDKAGRTFEGWAGVKKGVGSQAIRLPSLWSKLCLS